MKKILFLLLLTGSVSLANAQGNAEGSINMEVFRTCSMILSFGLLMIFVIVFLQRVFDYLLKKRIINQGIPENLAASLLKTRQPQDLHVNMKWFAILAGSGLGLGITYYTQPIGIHSLAILCFSISLSFLGYFLYLRKVER